MNRDVCFKINYFGSGKKALKIFSFRKTGFSNPTAVITLSVFMGVFF